MDKYVGSKEEWDNEPDNYQFMHKGIKCEAKRNDTGIWCSYAVFNATPFTLKIVEDYPNVTTLNVHGGITFAVETEEPTGYVIIGFDCGHSSDLSPLEMVHPYAPIKELYETLFEPNDKERTYKNLDFVIKETKHMVDQILEKS